MRKGQEVEGKIVRVDFPDKCVVEVPDADRPVIVKRGLPGQIVRVRITKVRKNRAEGRLLAVLEKAPNEQSSPCPHFGSCGGCTYQNLPYEAQLALKRAQLHDVLDPVIIGDPAWEGIEKSPRLEAYRNKMEFTFGDACKDGPLSLGLHEIDHFYDIVDVPQCRIVDEDFRQILIRTRALAAEAHLPYYHRTRHTGYLRHLLVRKAARTGEILVDLVTTGEENEFPEAWAASMRDLPLTGTLVGVLHTVNDSVADTITDEGTFILYGQDFFYEELLGLRFQITPFSFFQTNSYGAEVLYQTVRDFIGPMEDPVIYDLYCGTGTIAQILAPMARQVVGVEIVEEAVQAARENARLNGLSNCTFYAGDVLQVVDTLPQRPDLIVLDPPRDGVHPKALEKILNFGVDSIVYISCKMTSLARDLTPIQAAGYRVERVRGVDLFPGTVHTETVVLLRRSPISPS